MLNRILDFFVVLLHLVIIGALIIHQVDLSKKNEIDPAGFIRSCLVVLVLALFLIMFLGKNTQSFKFFFNSKKRSLWCAVGVLFLAVSIVII